MSGDTRMDGATDGAGVARRRVLTGVGLGAAAMAAANWSVPAQAQVLHDPDVLNFALNLEYLEATYYSYAVTGQDIPANLTTGVGQGGAPITTNARQITFSSAIGTQLAQEIYRNEMSHVEYLRNALGSNAVARPAIDLYNSFNALSNAAGLGPTFDAFAADPQDVPFLIATFGFEDVGVTAYAGGSTLLQNKAVLLAAARILPVEAYHAGEARTRLLLAGPTAIHKANAISAARGTASATAPGGQPKDQGITVLNPPGGPTSDAGVANVVPSDGNALAYARTAAEVLHVVYLGKSLKGGFFPSGVNGTINA